MTLKLAARVLLVLVLAVGLASERCQNPWHPFIDDCRRWAV